MRGNLGRREVLIVGVGGAGVQANAFADELVMSAGDLEAIAERDLLEGVGGGGGCGDGQAGENGP